MIPTVDKVKPLVSKRRIKKLPLHYIRYTQKYNSSLDDYELTQVDIKFVEYHQNKFIMD